MIPDLPTIKSDPFVTAARKHDIDPIFMATPACRIEDPKAVADLGSGYTYVITRKGVTGTQVQSEFTQANNLVEKLIALSVPPAVFGFGIRDHWDVLAASKAGAKGVIIGSALIASLQQLSNNEINQDGVVRRTVNFLFNGESIS